MKYRGTPEHLKFMATWVIDFIHPEFRFNDTSKIGKCAWICNVIKFNHVNYYSWIIQTRICIDIWDASPPPPHFPHFKKQCYDSLELLVDNLLTRA